jgi:CHAT domain-containing protein/tetratricopeptide (TPR) repeat protein
VWAVASLLVLLAVPAVWYSVQKRAPDSDIFRSSATIELIDPADGSNVRVLQDFRWQPVASIPEYTFAVSDPTDGHIEFQVVTSQPFFLLRKEDAGRLVVGQEYLWTVTGHFASASFRSSSRRFQFSGEQGSNAASSFSQAEKDDLTRRSREGNPSQREALRQEIERHLQARKGIHSSDRAWLLATLGTLLYRLHREEEARETLLESVREWETIGVPDVLNYARTLNNAGLAAQKTSHFEDALASYRKALAIYRQHNEPDWLAKRSDCLVNLGTLLRRLGLPEQAEKVYKEARDIDDAGLDPGARAETLNNLGNIYIEEFQDVQSGISVLERALQMHKEAAAHNKNGRPLETMADTLDSLADAQRLKGDTSAARRLYEAAIDLDRTNGNNSGTLITMNNLGELLEDDFADLPEALHWYNRALRIIKEKSEDVDVDETWRTYNGLGRISARLGDERQAETYLLRAIQIVETLRRGLLDRQERRLFKARRSQPYYDLASLRTKAGDVAGGFDAIEAARATGLMETPAGAGLTKPAALSTLHMSLGTDVLALEYCVGGRDDPVILFASFRGQSSLSLLPPVARLEPLIQRAWREFAADERRPELSQRLRQLAGDLLPQPLADVIRSGSISRVIVSPDGILNRVPFEELPVEQTEQSPSTILDHVAVSTVPSLTWWATREVPRTRPTQRKKALVFADPVISDKLCTTQSAYLSEVMSGRSHFQPLPLSGREGRVVSGYAGGDSQILSRSSCSSGALAAANPQDFQILHFATHARSGSSLSTSMLLFGCTRGLDVLMGDEVARLKLNGQLVVLSACEGGTGRALGGEGADSLAYGFLLGGAGCVVASRWLVQDNVALGTMEQFYEELSRGSTPAQALRKANLRSRAMWPNRPLTWASFETMGSCDYRLDLHPSLRLRAGNIVAAYWIYLVGVAVAAVGLLLARRYLARPSSGGTPTE